MAGAPASPQDAVSQFAEGSGEGDEQGLPRVGFCVGAMAMAV